ncbi:MULTISPECIES: helix-turn-helix domain-containing protein [unclassified Enterococcus]|uniref:helix-turn-helix domain-containing protein n=1 Tax=unclassified Enterococcus TaxID=2608891 RepID=UPI001CE0E67B|nr:MULTISPECIES: helix-turn-helix domain-containing protein [unclassified Enterococcus]MCA5014521.1 hypothetical protein [Enterococcus sp. S23]MCA5017774.1 hypothetical protein [Enterococcus sp. S22(2020)]
MINLAELKIMTFPEASERWNRERTFVFQKYFSSPDKFLPGSVDVIGNGKGTWIITKEGMEHLTGQTEKEANAGLWRVIVEFDFRILEEHSCDSEGEARSLLETLARKELIKRSPELLDQVKFSYLDKQKRNYGVRIAGNTVIYAKKISKK